MNVTVKIKEDLGIPFESIGVGFGFKHRDDFYIKIYRTEAIRYSPNTGVSPKLVTFGISTKVLPLPDTEIIFK